MILGTNYRQSNCALRITNCERAKHRSFIKLYLQGGEINWYLRIKLYKRLVLLGYLAQAHNTHWGYSTACFCTCSVWLIFAFCATLSCSAGDVPPYKATHSARDS